MKQLAILLLVLAAVGLHAQSNDHPQFNANFKRIQIGVNVSTDICYRTLKNNDGTQSIDLVKQVQDRSQIARVGFTTGLNICYNHNRNFGVETGIQYSLKGYQTKTVDVMFAQPQPGDPIKVKSIYNYHYFDIPVKANWIFGKKKVRFIASLGLTTNIFIKETATGVIVYPDRTVRKTNPTTYAYNRVNITPTISAGIDYTINKRLNLRIEPTFRYGVL